MSHKWHSPGNYKSEIDFAHLNHLIDIVTYCLIVVTSAKFASCLWVIFEWIIANQDLYGVITGSDVIKRKKLCVKSSKRKVQFQDFLTK
jgi:hypothetical protein